MRAGRSPGRCSQPRLCCSRCWRCSDPAAALASEPTNSGDNLRDGWYPEQGSLTPQLVSGGTFGQLWSANVEGSVYAQPLLVNGEVLVATENNKVYGLDPNTGAMKWSTLAAPRHARGKPATSAAATSRRTSA